MYSALRIGPLLGGKTSPGALLAHLGSPLRRVQLALQLMLRHSDDCVLPDLMRCRGRRQHLLSLGGSALDVCLHVFLRLIQELLHFIRPRVRTPCPRLGRLRVWCGGRRLVRHRVRIHHLRQRFFRFCVHLGQVLVGLVLLRNLLSVDDRRHLIPHLCSEFPVQPVCLIVRGLERVPLLHHSIQPLLVTAEDALKGPERLHQHPPHIRLGFPHGLPEHMPPRHPPSLQEDRGRGPALAL
mmetsp:Transcript_67674/g.161537  ORF Transcript_67674/g.161537 Transcript_67674/m.161537 type:complete len:239 (-) Transcript_67674:298-1014(-)